jgi:hypothetical protein
MDRGPDGIGVVDLVMRIQAQADAAGGRVGVVLGNHEILALGMHRFGLRPAPGDVDALSLALTWQANGGRIEDQEALTDRHIEWMAGLPAVAVREGVLLMHCDSARYLEYAHDAEGINDGISKAVAYGDRDAWWECLRRMTDRYAFAQPGGAEKAAEVMSELGAGRLVHGHSIIADLRGIEPAETDGALLYGDRRVLAIDGGIYAGGPCLVVDLDAWPEP